MKKILLLLFTIIGINMAAQEKPSKTALILIDIQDFYYPGGDSELYQPEKAGKNAQKILQKFRQNKEMVIHVRHNYEPGGNIHKDVAPIAGEKIFSKDHANSFLGTGLLDYLKENNITDLVLAGMQTHMCLEATTRAASDYGFNCTVIEDACTTKDLKYNGHVIKAMDVHYSTLATLKSYAKITDTNSYLSKDTEK